MPGTLWDLSPAPAETQDVQGLLLAWRWEQQHSSSLIRGGSVLLNESPRSWGHFENCFKSICGIESKNRQWSFPQACSVFAFWLWSECSLHLRDASLLSFFSKSHGLETWLQGSGTSPEQHPLNKGPDVTARCPCGARLKALSSSRSLCLPAPARCKSAFVFHLSCLFIDLNVIPSPSLIRFPSVNLPINSCLIQ